MATTRSAFVLRDGTTRFSVSIGSSNASDWVFSSNRAVAVLPYGGSNTPISPTRTPFERSTSVAGATGFPSFRMLAARNGTLSPRVCSLK